MKILVIGIGQSMRGDDGAGLEAVRRWQQAYPRSSKRPEITVETSELPGLDFLDLLKDADAATLVDAVCSGSPAATIHRLDPQQLSAFPDVSRSVHGWGLAETLAMAGKLKLPAARIPIQIIGIEAAQMEMGEILSPQIVAAMPQICTAIEESVQSLLR